MPGLVKLHESHSPCSRATHIFRGKVNEVRNEVLCSVTAEGCPHSHEKVEWVEIGNDEVPIGRDASTQKSHRRRKILYMAEYETTQYDLKLISDN